MHMVSWAYPDVPDNDTRRRAYTFLHALAEVIPCRRCRVDWSRYLDKHLHDVDSPNLDSRFAFTTFLVDGHNYVNRKLQKREYAYEEARLLYDPSAPQTEGRTRGLLKLLVLIVVCMIGAYGLVRNASVHRKKRLHT